MQIDGKNYHFGNPQNDIGINEITRNNQNLKSIFEYFDKNGDNKLSTEEIKQAFSVFTKLDQANGKKDGKLTDKEIENGLKLFSKNSKITTADYKNFIRSLASTNDGKKLANDLLTQISGPSLNDNTLALLSKIDETNVLEVIKQYNKISPKESLASAVDNEWGLEIKDVKSKICSPLVARAKILNIKNISHEQYQNIKNINDLNKFINSTVKKIETVEIKIAQTDSIEPIKRNRQYKPVSNVVTMQLIKRFPNGKGGFYTDISQMPKNEQAKYLEKAENITKMVIEKCQKYDIEEIAPVIADVLGNESGGYNFCKKSMENPGGLYKGVMQVDFKTCQCIYSEGGKINEAWHKAHFSQDDARIDEMKKKYPTAKDLFQAIQKDVELGLEVGIIALKAKIHEAKNSVSGGISKYCGGNYSCNLINVPNTINFI